MSMQSNMDYIGQITTIRVDSSVYGVNVWDFVFNLPYRAVIIGISPVKASAAVSEFICNTMTSVTDNLIPQHKLLRVPLVAGFDYSDIALSPGQHKFRITNSDLAAGVIVTLLKIDQ